MRRTICLLGALIALCACSGGDGGGGGGAGGGSKITDPNPPDQSATLSGTVREEGTAAPIGGATVTAGTASATAALDGSYSISGAPKGSTVAVTASAAGFNSVTKSTTIRAGPNKQDFSLTRQSTVPADFDTIAVDGKTRYFRLYDPLPQPHPRVPLVIMLHGASRDSVDRFRWVRTAATYTGLDALADGAGFVVLYPMGPYSGDGRIGWIVVDEDRKRAPGIDDVKFISTVVDTLVRAGRIDSLRVFATGLSYGGSMAYRLAHNASSRVRAVAVVAGLDVPSPSAAPDPVAILHMHALDDVIMSFTGDTLSEPMPGVAESLAGWRTAQNCAVAPDTVFYWEYQPEVAFRSRSELGMAASESIVGLRWRSADGKGDVFLYTSTRGGHNWPQWPGFDATRVIWNFFAGVPPR